MRALPLSRCRPPRGKVGNYCWLRALSLGSTLLLGLIGLGELTFGTTLALGLIACSSDPPPGDTNGGAGGTSGAGANGGTAGGGAGGDNAGGSGGAGGDNAGGSGGAGGDSAGGSGGSGGAGGDSAGGSGGSGGGDGCGAVAGTAGVGGDPGPEPVRISETGLYSDTASKTLAPCVERYEPQFKLWSDGAAKVRYIYLPPGSKVDTSDMDFWRFPVGTKLWKEFWREKTGSADVCREDDPDLAERCVRVETRLLEKIADEDGFWETNWRRLAFVWRDDDSDADLANKETGLDNVRGTSHLIPKQQDCGSCHFQLARTTDGDAILGFSAIQLSHDRPGLNLAELGARGWLSDPPAQNFTLPGTSDEQQALGYMHGNCGGCHNARAGMIQTATNMVLWLSTAALESVSETPSYETTVDQPVTSLQMPLPEQPPNRVVRGKPAESALLYRMQLEPGLQSHMPQVGVKERDPDGEALVEAWINSL